MSFYTPKEAYPVFRKAILHKLHLSLSHKISLGITAGVFISIGALSYLIAMSTIAPLNIGIAKFIGSMIFAIGLTSITIGGGELLTGHFLLGVSLLEKECLLKDVIKNWCIVFFVNLIGALLFALLTISLGNLGDAGIELFKTLGINKTTTDWSMLLARAIGCNFLVCLGIWLASTSMQISGKFLVIVFTVFTFVFLGFEHSVANMYFLPVAWYYAPEITLSGMIYNILIVTLGNALGGFALSILLYFGFHTKKDTD